MRNSPETRWLRLAIVVLCVAGGLRTAQAAGPLDELRRRATALDVPPGVTFEVTLVDGLVVTWKVGFEAGPILEALPAAGVEPPDARGAITAWSDTIHQRLAALTAEVMPEHDPHFNPETDVVVSVVGSVRPRTEEQEEPPSGDAFASYFHLEYRGPRRVQTVRSMLGGAGPAPDVELSDETELTVEIVPRKLVWGLRETINGTVRLRNTGSRRLPLPALYFRFGGVGITDEAGVKPEFFLMRGHISWAPLDHEYRLLLPGETIDEPFAIHTDRQTSGLVNGFIVPEGRWLLGHKSFLDEVNVPTRVAPVLVEVRAPPGAYTGPRIVDVQATGDRLLLQREPCTVEVVTAATGERVGGPVTCETWRWGARWSVISPDGRLVVGVEPRQRRVHIHRVGGDEASTTVDLPETVELGQGGLSPRCISADGRRLFATTNHRVFEIDLETGAVLTATDAPTMWPDLSPDGRFLADVSRAVQAYNPQVRGLDRMTITIAERLRPEAARTVVIQGHGEWPETLAGRRGLYLVDAFNPGVLYVPYEPDDGQDGTLSFDTGNVGLQAESPDGRLLAVVAPGGPSREAERLGQRPGPSTVEVWDVQTRRKLYEIDAETRQEPMFVTDPLRLVCAVTAHSSSASWYSERYRIYDAETGRLVGEIDLTPR